MEKFTEWLNKYNKIILLTGLGIVIALTIYGYQMGIFTDQEKMAVFLEQCGIFAPLVFIAVMSVQVFIPIVPGIVGYVYGTVFFGIAIGFLLNYIGTCLGSVIAFLIARKWGKEFVHKITGKKFYEKYHRHIMNEKQFDRLFFVLILLPLAPDDFLCYIAGISNMKFKKFILIILFAKPIAIFAYSVGVSKIYEYITSYI